MTSMSCDSKESGVGFSPVRSATRWKFVFGLEFGYTPKTMRFLRPALAIWIFAFFAGLASTLETSEPESATASLGVGGTNR